MKAKLLNLKTLFITMFCAASALGASAYDFYSNGIYYNVLDNGTVEVTSQSANGYPTDTYVGVITIPEQVTYNGNTYQVTRIGYQAFSLSTLTELPTTPLTVQGRSPKSFCPTHSGRCRLQPSASATPCSRWTSRGV